MSVLWYHFSDAVCMRASGKDARRYLNNRLSNDLRSLASGESTLAAALTAQGKVECLCSVFAEAQDLFYLVADAGKRQPIFAALGKFIVADRISIEDLGSSVVFAHVTTSVDSISSVLSGLGASCFSRSCARLGVSGVDVLVVGADPSTVLERIRQAYGESLSGDAYKLLRCKQGQPVFPDEVNDRVILTECGMRSAVSFSKGCYVGQEVIERSDAIGKLPRSLARVRLAGGGDVPQDAPLLNARGEAIGKVVTVAFDTADSCAYLFALLKSGSYSIGDAVSSCGIFGEILSMEQGAT